MKYGTIAETRLGRFRGNKGLAVDSMALSNEPSSAPGTFGALFQKSVSVWALSDTLTLWKAGACERDE